MQLQRYAATAGFRYLQSRPAWEPASRGAKLVAGYMAIGSSAGLRVWDLSWITGGLAGLARAAVILVGLPAAIMIWRRHPDAPAAFLAWALSLLIFRVASNPVFLEPDPLWMSLLFWAFGLALLFIMYREVVRNSLPHR